MTRNIATLTWMILFLLASAVWANCPEDEYDRGICDTMYVEPWSDDIPPAEGPPYFIRVPIYVTCDVVNDLDSVAGFTIPLCYTADDPGKYCSLSAYWNTTPMVYTYPGFDRSIFRHIEGTTHTARNRMADMAAEFLGKEWDLVILDLDGISYFWLNMVPIGTADQSWWEGSRVLLATMTFKAEDHLEICLDTCLWPPSSRLAWGIRKDDGTGWTKIPRSGTGTDVYGGCFGTSDVREISTAEDSRPSGFSLSQNYPNPFNPVTHFEFSLTKSAQVKIEIFNISGQSVRTVVDEDLRPGAYVADWDGRNEKGDPVSSGVYFYRMQAGAFSETKKMVLLR